MTYLWPSGRNLHVNEARSCCGTARMIHQPDDLAESHLQLFGAQVHRESGQMKDWLAVLGKKKKLKKALLFQSLLVLEDLGFLWCCE